jgi:hypothetical protein
MTLDPKASVIRWRKSEIDEARRALSEALADEVSAEEARREAEVAIVAETSRAARSDSDLDVERFASWLKQGRSRLSEAETRLAEAAVATAYQRAALALARAAAEMADPIIHPLSGDLVTRPPDRIADGGSGRDRSS